MNIAPPPPAAAITTTITSVRANCDPKIYKPHKNKSHFLDNSASICCEITSKCQPSYPQYWTVKYHRKNGTCPLFTRQTLPPPCRSHGAGARWQRSVVSLMTVGYRVSGDVVEYRRSVFVYRRHRVQKTAAGCITSRRVQEISCRVPVQLYVWGQWVQARGPLYAAYTENGE